MNWETITFDDAHNKPYRFVLRGNSIDDNNTHDFYVAEMREWLRKNDIEYVWAGITLFFRADKDRTAFILKWMK